MNKARAKRIYQDGNTILDDKGNIWNVLEVDSSIKSKRCWYQLMQLRDHNGKRKFDKLIQGKPGRTLRIAKNHLIHKFFNDKFKRIKYDSIHNKVLKIIE